MKKGKQMKLIILMTALLLLAAAGSHGEELTLDKAIEIGLQNNYSIQIARNNAKISANNKGEGTAGFLPTIDASGGYELGTSDEESNSAGSLGDTDSENLNAQLALNWTIFDGLKMFADKAQFDALAKLGEYQARDIIESNVVAISSTYFNLVQLEQLLDVARESRDISLERFNQEKVRNELGGASTTDLLNAQVAYNTDQSSLIEQELQVEIAAKDLNILLGRDPATPVTVVKEIVIPQLVVDYDGLLLQAQEYNAAILSARQNMEIANQSLKGARSNFFPKLALNASYGYTDRTTSSSPSPSLFEDITTETTSGTVGLQLTFNLFKGGRDKIKLTNAKIEANNQRLALRDEEIQLAGQVRQTWDTFNRRMELVRLEEENVVAARQNIELQQDRYKLGVTGSLDFRDAQVSYIRAQTTLISARFQARISRLEIDQLIGKIKVS